MSFPVVYTNISVINFNLKIDIQFFNSRIYTTNDRSVFNNLSDTDKDSEKNYLCISTQVELDEYTVIGDINIKPQFILILTILTYLTKTLFDQQNFGKSFPSNGKLQEVENSVFDFNDVNYKIEFDKIIELLASNKESKKQLFHKKIERYYKSFFTDDINFE